MAGGVVVVGSFNVDHAWSLDALPVPGETRSGMYASGPGGKGFNQATAAARSGARTRFVCALGADAGGQLARALAVADDIDLCDAAIDLPTGSAGIFVDAAARNSIVVAPGANGRLDAAHVAHALASGDAPAVVLVQLETPVEAARAALAAARGHDALAMLNPAPANAGAPADLLADVDILTPNETEFAALVKAHLGETLDPATVADSDDGRLHALCRRLLPRGTCLVTLGGAGAFVSHAEDACRGDARSHYRMPAFGVTPVDTTGAGDAFNGALAASLARGAAVAFERHVRFAAAYAGLSTERPGAALAMPRLDEVRARFPDLAPAH